MICPPSSVREPYLEGGAVQSNFVITVQRPSFSPIPIEICETIIDQFGGCYDWLPNARYTDTPEVLWECYDTLCACSLTCRAWLPRSRWNLYQSIYLSKDTASGSFARTLRQYPYLASTVHQVELRINRCTPPSKSWHLLPLRLASLPLDRVKVLYIWQTNNAVEKIDIGSNAHPTFLMACSRFRSISELTLSQATFPTFNTLSSLLGSLPLLVDLTLLYLSIMKHAKNPVTAVIKSTLPQIKRVNCRERVLERGVCFPLLQWLTLTGAARRLEYIKEIRIKKPEKIVWIRRLLSKVEPTCLRHVTIVLKGLFSGKIDLSRHVCLTSFQLSTVPIQFAVSTLSTLASPSLETIILGTARSDLPATFDYFSFESPSLWEALAELLTSKQYSSLRSVKITVSAFSYADETDEIANAQREKAQYKISELLSPLEKKLGRGFTLDIPMMPSEA